MKIYIAGPITNNPGYEKQFAKAEEALLAEGHLVINPAKNPGTCYKDYLDIGLCELMKCDAICLLPGWEESKGARLENHYARAAGLTIYHIGVEGFYEERISEREYKET